MSRELFAPTVGSEFRLRAPDGAFGSDRTDQAHRPQRRACTPPSSHCSSGCPDGGPTEQDVYTLEHEAIGSVQLLLVPVAQVEDGLLFEAAFALLGGRRRRQKARPNVQSVSRRDPHVRRQLQPTGLGISVADSSYRYPRTRRCSHSSARPMAATVRSPSAFPTCRAAGPSTQGQGPGLPTSYVLGQAGGVETVTLTGRPASRPHPSASRPSPHAGRSDSPAGNALGGLERQPVRHRVALRTPNWRRRLIGFVRRQRRCPTATSHRIWRSISSSPSRASSRAGTDGATDAEEARQ